MEQYTRSFIERYQTRHSAHKDFELHSLRLIELFSTSVRIPATELFALLTPMIAIAWSDGKIGTFERDTILRAAEIYGLFEDEGACEKLVATVTSRPTTKEIDTGWKTIARLSGALPPDELAVFTSLLYQQTKFIGEMAEKYSFGHLGDVGLGREEREELEMTEDRIVDLLSGSESIAEHPELTELRQLDERLMQAIPLVKVAWADGSVSRREREMIFDSISHFGIEHTPENLAKLAEWLEFRPDDAFFQESLRRLGFELADRTDSSRQEAKYEIISRCTLIADASGANSSNGGIRICDEEIRTVKEIAKLLNAGFRSGQ